MSKIKWLENDRKYESGIDRGVLYPHVGGGVAWDGLVSVETELNISEPEGVFLDGFKVRENRTLTPFEASLKAYTYPDEFMPYFDFEEQTNGVYIGQQTTEFRFGLCYRSFVNDGPHYRLHLMYNLSATPAGSLYSTFASTIEPTVLVWKLTSIPLNVPRKIPTSHIILDSYKMNVDDLAHIESVLYGSNGLPARLLSPSDLVGSW